MGPRAAVALGIAAYLVFLAATVPAAFVAPRIAAATGQPVEIDGAAGTLWKGEARARVAPPNAAPIAVERIEWRFLPLRLAAGEIAVALRVTAAGLTAGLEAARGFSGYRLRDLKGEGEAKALGLLSPIVATWQPGGTLAFAAERLDWDGKALSGEARLEWRSVTTALSEVRPLGSYRATLRATGGPATVELATLDGALRLAGRGTLDPGGRVAFSGEARAEAARAADLAALLALLGPRRPDGAHAIEWRSP